MKMQLMDMHIYYASEYISLKIKQKKKVLFFHENAAREKSRILNYIESQWHAVNGAMDAVV